MYRDDHYRDRRLRVSDNHRHCHRRWNLLYEDACKVCNITLLTRRYRIFRYIVSNATYRIV